MEGPNVHVTDILASCMKKRKGRGNEESKQNKNKKNKKNVIIMVRLWFT
jgi:hypothetical protein